jgi:ferredoxin-NADP reductase
VKSAPSLTYRSKSAEEYHSRATLRQPRIAADELRFPRTNRQRRTDEDFHMDEYIVTLKDRKQVAQDTMAFWLEVPGTGYIFRAGQNAAFTLLDPPETDAAGNIRTLSMASSPNAPSVLMVSMRMRTSAFKNSLRMLPLGAQLKVSSPMGSFTLHRDSSRPAVFLVGGIGITPVLSILAHATEKGLPHRIFLFYSNHDPEKAAFLDELYALQKTNANFTFVPTVTNPDGSSWSCERGRIDREMLARYLSETRRPVYYVCGPAGFVAAMQMLLAYLYVDENSIRTEEFGGY